MNENQIKNKIADIKSYIISEYCSIDQAKKLYIEIKYYEDILKRIKS